MALHEVIAPTTDASGYESHPAWVLVGVSRVTAGPPGRALFDSDIRHQHYMLVRLRQAERKRDLNRDWIHASGGGGMIAEFAMSEAQWAAFVSSVNTGDGVPATLEFNAAREDPYVPEFPYEPRLAESMAEVHGAAQKGMEEVMEAFAAYKEHKTVANLRTLEARLNNLPSNLRFAAESLTEHAEDVVTKARADIEATVLSKARQLGLNPSDLAVGLPELGTGEEES